MVDGYVLVIGAMGIDTKGHALDYLKPSTSNPGQVKSTSGGVARNITENLTRLGQETILISAIGEDRSGVRLKNRLVDAGADINHIIVSPDYHTGAYIALYDQNKSLIHSIHDMEVMEAITAQRLYRNRRLIHQAKMVVIDANLLPEAINSVIKQATTKQVPVVADPTATTLAGKLKPYLSDLYMITPNASEAEVLSEQPVTTRQEAMQAAHTLVSKGVDIVVITLAEMGVVYATSDTSGHIPALTANIVDLTGASDALTAAIIFGLLNDFSIDEAVRLGASAAFLTLQSEDSVIHTLSLDNLYEL